MEMLREVGKSQEERAKITKGLEDRTKQREKSSQESAEHFGLPEEQISGGEVLRYELWKEHQMEPKSVVYLRDQARVAGEEMGATTAEFLCYKKIKYRF